MGLGRGWACIGIQLIYSKALPTRIGQVGPRGRVGPSRAVRAEWGWGGLGHALGNYSKTRRWLRIGQVGPRGAGSGRVGPSRAG